jgi:polysaccharide biosynthesis/export protein
MHKHNQNIRIKAMERLPNICGFAFAGVHKLAVTAAMLFCVYAGLLAQQNLAGGATGTSARNGKGSKGPSPHIDQPAQYIVGEGDLLRVSVWKESEITQNVVVRPDGKISLPLITEIRVAGLSPEQIQQLVTEKLKAVLTSPQVTVTVLEVHSKEVYITGEVGKPGAYQELAPMNVLQLIARAGGLSEFANRKAIYIFRAGDPKTRLRFNYKEVVNGHRPEQNIILQPGDTVVVP